MTPDEQIALMESPAGSRVLQIAIRPGVIVLIQDIPWDFTPAEAARISAVILAHTAPDCGNPGISRGLAR
jgi:hypothetical protein